jgi:hypothetical protein
MKFKLDENLDRRLVGLFADAGHDARTVGEQSLSGCPERPRDPGRLSRPGHPEGLIWRVVAALAGGWYDPIVLSEEQIELYRRMSIEERWRIVEELMTLAWRALLELPYEERERRLQIAREEHDAGCRALAEALRKLE